MEIWLLIDGFLAKSYNVTFGFDELFAKYQRFLPWP
jgi:hypothetical protein